MISDNDSDLLIVELFFSAPAKNEQVVGMLGELGLFLSPMTQGERMFDTNKNLCLLKRFFVNISYHFPENQLSSYSSV